MDRSASPTQSISSAFSDISNYEGTLISASVVAAGVAVRATSSQLQLVSAVSVKEWTPADVAVYMQRDFPAYAALFEQQRISGDLLAHLTTRDLRDMGIVALRDRLAIRQSIGELTQHKKGTSTLSPDAWVYEETLDLTNTLLNEISIDLGKNAAASNVSSVHQSTASELKRMNEKILKLKDEMAKSMRAKPSRLTPAALASPVTPAARSPATRSPVASNVPEAHTPPRRPDFLRQKSSNTTITTTLGAASPSAGHSSENLALSSSVNGGRASFVSGAIATQTATAPANPSARAPSTPTSEPLKQLRASTGDACYKILQQAMRRHRLPLEDWRKYVLVICYGDQERILRMDEKPVVVFRELREMGQHPAIMLRQVDNGEDEGESQTPGGKL